MLRNKSIWTLVNNYYRQAVYTGPTSYILVKENSLYRFSRCYSKSSSGDSKGKNTTSGGWRTPSSPCPTPLDVRQAPKGPPHRDCDPASLRVDPRIQPCGQPNAIDSSPQPDCAHDGQSSQGSKWNKWLLASILLTAGTCFWIFKSKSAGEEMGELQMIKKTSKKTPTKVPLSSGEIPKSIPYLLIGGGTASFSAFRSIKALDPKAKVLVITDEMYLPYMRPPLSKEMWFNEDSEKAKELIFKQWNGKERSLLYEPEDFYVACKDLDTTTNGGVAIARGWRIDRIDPYNRTAYLDDGYEIKYEKCLLATGAKPKNINVFSKAQKHIQDKIMLFREAPDFSQLSQVMRESESIAIVGGGFLGSELACAIARRAKTANPKMKVYQIFKEPGNMHKVLPEYLSRWTTDQVSKEGVKVITNAEIQDAVLQDKDTISLILSNGKTVSANKVVVAVGVDPNTELAEKSGLEVEPECGGFLVNAELEARSHLFAAGDCSCFYDVKFGRRRVEHHDHAVVSGRLAGENMVGEGKPYLHQSMFWSDLGPDVGYEAIGLVDASLPTVGVFAKGAKESSTTAAPGETGDNLHSTVEMETGPDTSSAPTEVLSEAPENDQYDKGVIFYLRDGLVVGILLWNLFNRTSIARQILKEDRKYDDLNEVAKLFKIFD